MPLPGKVPAEGFDEGAFSGAGHSGNPNPDRSAGGWQQFVQQGGSGDGVIEVAAFDEGNRLGQRPALSLHDSGCNIVELDHVSKSLGK